MIPEAITWFGQRYRPRDGWLAFFLMLAITLVVAYQVSVTRMVPEGGIAWITVISLCLAIILIQRRVGWLSFWLLLSGYGLVLTTLWLGSLWPPFGTVLDGWGAASDHLRQNWSLVTARAAAWLEAVSTGESSRETIVFAFILGLLAWFVIAAGAWLIFRQRRPVSGVLVIGMAMAFNGFYGEAPLAPLAMFIGLAVLLVATMELSSIQQRWEGKGIDYPTDIRVDLITNGAAIAMFLMALGFFAPEVNFRSIYRAVFDRPAVHQLEAELERIFAGVQVAGGRGSQDGEGGSRAGGSLPRSFLLGDGPELYETIVLTATVNGDIGGAHWRGTSYDIYTGRGWALSEEDADFVPAGERLPQPAYKQTVNISQQIVHAEGNNPLRFSLGQPIQYDQDVETYWRDTGDLSRVVGQGQAYSVLSQVMGAGLDDLLRLDLNDVPQALLDRYTRLPETVPERVHQLAGEIASGVGSSGSPVEIAFSIEQFTRQYPYSLEVSAPPAGSDPVDFFLFEEQAGYCDYYASAMVVLARSLGLPARLATGYLAQPVDEAGRQIIYQINAHSWAEIYFTDVGWLEFEPTAGFASPVRASDSNQPTRDEAGFADNSQPPAIPARQPHWQELLWLLIPLTVGVGVVFLLVRRQQKRAEANETVWAYGRLLRGAGRLGQATPPNQTPAEFEEAILERLATLQEHGLTRRFEPSRMAPEIQGLTRAFGAQQYSRLKEAVGSPGANWRRMRWRYWIIGHLYRFSQLWERNGKG